VTILTAQRRNFTDRFAERLLPAASEAVAVNRTETDLRALSARWMCARAADEIVSLTVRLTFLVSLTETLLRL
jgi:hypothetical protein